MYQGLSRNHGLQGWVRNDLGLQWTHSLLRTARCFHRSHGIRTVCAKSSEKGEYVVQRDQTHLTEKSRQGLCTVISTDVKLQHCSLHFCCLYVYGFRADCFVLGNESGGGGGGERLALGEATSPSLSSHLLPVVLCQGVGPGENYFQ